MHSRPPAGEDTASSPSETTADEAALVCEDNGALIAGEATIIAAFDTEPDDTAPLSDRPPAAGTRRLVTLAETRTPATSAASEAAPPTDSRSAGSPKLLTLRRAERVDLAVFYRDRVLPYLRAEDVFSEVTFASRKDHDWRGPCPLHDGANPTVLSVKPESLLWNCHVCQKGGDALDWLNDGEKVKGAGRAIFEEVVRKAAAIAGVPMPDEPGPTVREADRAPKPHPRSEHIYCDAQGEPRYRVVRMDRGPKRKDVWQERRCGCGAWTPGLDVRPCEACGAAEGNAPAALLYMLPELHTARTKEPEAWVLVAEGERKVDGLRARGFVATCNSGGAAKWPRGFESYFAGANVAVLADHDEPGEKHIRMVAENLCGVAQLVKVIRFAELPKSGDVLDWLDQGHTADELRERIEDTSAWTPEPEAGAVAVDARGSQNTTSTPHLQKAWPVPEPAAFYGVVGDAVRLIEPHSETDPVAVLLQSLVVMGNAFGRGPHFNVEATRHTTNLYAAVVGESSKARKGTACDHVLRLVSTAAPEWPGKQGGLVSGEGLIYHVRDPIYGLDKKGTEVLTDEGVQDKRWLAVEAELGSTLRAMSREGNTLSGVLRAAWDSGELRTAVKNAPCRATNAHVSLIGHVTADEVRRYLDRTEAGNGFGNRILWALARRSKSLPEGGRISSVDFAGIVHRLGAAVTFAHAEGACEMSRDEEARGLWYAAYDELSEGRPGLLGSMLGRGEAQALRLSMVYAVLDCSSIIRRPHLEAALALWKYCEASAERIFGATLGDPTADTLVQALRGAADGLTQSEIFCDVFGKNHKAAEIARALGMLEDRGLARQETEATGARGRPAVRWFPGAT